MQLLEQFKRNLNDFLLENHMSETDLKIYLDDMSKNRAETRIKDKVNQHTYLEGRCFVKKLDGKGTMFPPMHRYYKVLSARSSNEYRLECLIFDEHPTYWFEYQTTKCAGDYYLGSFEFESFIVDSIMANEIEMMREIPTKEFNEAAKHYLEELLNLKFVNEHYRFGNKFPIDTDWPTAIK